MTVASTNLSLLYELALAFPEGLDRQGTFCLDQRAGDVAVELSSQVESECYELTWPTKAQTKQDVRRDAGLTLAPVNSTESSFAQARNLVITGDQVSALKVLQRPVLGMGGVKAVYCHLRPDLDQGYATLSLVRPLLRDDGCCFVFCDDAAALAYQRKLCDEVFGSNNFLATLVWQSDERASLKYILLYARANYDFSIGRLPRTAKTDERYKNPDNDPRGPWTSSDISVKTYSASCDYPITTPSGRQVWPAKGRAWSLSKESLARARADNRIWFGADGNNTPRLKRFLSEVKEGLVPTSVLLPEEMGSLVRTPGLTSALAQRLLILANLSVKADTQPDDTVLLVGAESDCAQMATALSGLNQERGTQYRFIWLSSLESLTELDELYRARDLPMPALRQLKLVPSAHWALPLSAYSQELLVTLVEAPAGDALARFYAYLVATGKDLSAPIECLELKGYQLLNYAQNQIWFCAEPGIGVELIYAVAAGPKRPQQLICPDACFATDSAKINCCEHATMLLGPDVLVVVS